MGEYNLEIVVEDDAGDTTVDPWIVNVGIETIPHQVYNSLWKVLWPMQAPPSICLFLRIPSPALI